MPMLTELVRYAQKQGLCAEPGFAPKTARWAVYIGEDGRLVSVTPIGDQERKRNPGMDFARCPDLEYSELMGGKEGGRRSQFLLDTTRVVALYGGRDEGGKPVEVGDEKVKAKHDHFVRLLREASSAMPELAAAGDCLGDAKNLADIRKQLAEGRAGPDDKVTLQIAGRFPLDSDAWHGWWRAFRAKLVTLGPPMRCFVSGDWAPAMLTHPKLMGLGGVGGQPSGTALVSFDAEAFRSGGMERSANYAVSEEAAWAYAVGLNHLLQGAETVAGNKVAYWFTEPVPSEDDPLHGLLAGVFAKQGQEIGADQRARELLSAIRTGERPDLAGNRYFAVTISGNAGRAVVRDWMEGSFEALAANVDAWFADLSIVQPDGGRLAPAPKFLAVLGSTVRKLDDLAAPFVARMWGVAVRNEPIPQAALAAAVRRARMAIVGDDPVRSAGMGLIKAYHVRKARNGGDDMPEDTRPYLNPDHPSPAYHSGRLMAVYAALQRSALGDVGAGVVQRYYAAASATPALILGRLARLSQAHLGKLTGGLTWWYETLLADVWGRLADAVPRTLDLEEQSLFALGYYQQLADLRTKKADQPKPGTGDAETQTDGSVSDDE
jgi:CRISPR-associated protein Csd1